MKSHDNNNLSVASISCSSLGRGVPLLWSVKRPEKSSVTPVPAGFSGPRHLQNEAETNASKRFAVSRR